MLGRMWTGSGRGELYCEVTPSGVNPLWVEPDLDRVRSVADQVYSN
jgi:hypothetical protein